MEMVEVAKYFAKAVFTLALTFFILALIALLLLGVNSGEEPVGVIVLAVNAVVMVCSGTVLVWTRKKEAEKEAKIRAEKVDTSKVERKTMDDWLNQREEEHE